MLQNYQEIKAIQEKINIFDPFKEEYIQGASYDLHIGDKVYVSSSENGSKGVIKLKEGETFLIPANGICMFQTLEKIKIPNDVAAKLSLRMGLVRKGLVMPAQTQADPGFNNFLFGLLYNLSNEGVRLSRSEHVVSIELFKLKNPTEKVYKENYNSMGFEDFISNYIQSSLDFLNQKISKSQSQLKASTYYTKILAIMYTIVGFILAALVAYLNFGPYNSLKEKYNSLQTEKKELHDQVDKLSDKINNLEKKIILFENKRDTTDITRLKR
jgi:deoxycytidine triphosphate deaminase